MTEQGEVAPSFLPHFPGFENRQAASDDGVIAHDSAPLISNLEFANIGERHPDWDDLGIDFVDFLNTQANGEMVQCLPTPLTDYTAQVQRALIPLSTSIPSVPTFNEISLIHRPNMSTGTSRTVNLILHTPKSYPLMIQRHNTLPPFIHPRLVSPEDENSAMERLTNRIHLVHMISHGVHGSRKLFWENVQLECERICIEELLAAMEALSSYVLIRLEEGETEQNNFDFLLRAAVTGICQQIAKQLAWDNITSNHNSTLYDDRLKPNCKEWMFEESRRRLAVVCRVLNMVVYFDPVAICMIQTDLILGPLPAKKELWEASEESAWKAETEREHGVQTDFGVAANGELVKLEEGHLYCDDTVLLC